MRSACSWVLGSVAVALAACGGSSLDQLPIDAGSIDRRGIVTTVGTSKNDAYVLYHTPGSSSADSLAHWDGQSFTNIPISMADATSIALLGAQHVAVGGIAVLDINGTSVNDVTSMAPGAASFAAAGNGNGYLYLVAYNEILRRTPGGSSFDPMPSPIGGFTEFVVADTDRFIALGDGNGDMANVFYHFDGTTWHAPNLTRTGHLLAAAAPDDAWAVPLPQTGGMPFGVEAWDGTSWSDVSVTIPAQMHQMDPGTNTIIGVVPLGNHRAAAVVTREYNTIPPYRELLWVTGDRSGGLSNTTVVRVYCQQTQCTDGGSFSGRPFLAADGTLFVGPYYGHVSTQ